MLQLLLSMIDQARQTTTSGSDNAEMRWLVLVHQFPQDPGSLRVKIWRRLQAVGAVGVKNSMYALPMNEQTREDFQWILGEIIAGGAEGAILESRFIDGMDDQQLRELFNAARDADYATLAEEIRQLQKQLPKNLAQDEEQGRDTKTQVARFRKRLKAIEQVDFFGANGRESTAGLLDSLARFASIDSAGAIEVERRAGQAELDDLKGRVWVTRRNVHVDRIASAWLIRRWIDRDAVFKFTSSKKYSPGNREVRFDMFDAEFTHEGDKCTFEVLLSRLGSDDPALECIAEIVHDIDLKENKYDHEETAGIATLLAGIAAGSDDDDHRLDRGGTLFDDLYRSFQGVKK